MVFTPHSVSQMQSPLSFSIIFRQRTPSSHWYPPTLKTGWMAVIDIKRNTRTEIILIPTVPARDIRSLSIKKKKKIPILLATSCCFPLTHYSAWVALTLGSHRKYVLLVDCACQVLGWPRRAFRFFCYIIRKTWMNVLANPTLHKNDGACQLSHTDDVKYRSCLYSRGIFAWIS